MSDVAAKPKRSDRRRVLITPEGIALPVTLASRGTRFGAVLVDLTIIFVTMIVSTFGLIYVAGKVMSDSAIKFGKGGLQMPPAVQFVVILYIAFLFLVRHGYFLFFELGPRGATPGKRMTGIRVAARDGGRLTTEMVLARNLLRDVELTLPIFAALSLSGGGIAEWLAFLWFAVFALFPVFNRDRLRAGDLVAGSWVVEARRLKLADALSTGSAAVSGTSQTTGASYKFGDEELAIYGEYELQTLERVLRENRQEAMSAVHEAICRKIGWNPGAGDERAFLEAYYTQLRARLEGGMRMGKRKADKHSSGAT
jgi:uncharacterized RDD family membrane protein YckC